MSSEQPWPNTPPDLADSPPQYADPYQAQPYSYGGAPQDPSQPQGYAAESGYGYPGYGESYGYESAGGYAGTGYAGGGYPDAGGQPSGAAQEYAGYAGYNQYDEYGQYQQYDQYGQPYGQPQVDPDPYAQSQTDAYVQPQADPYAQPQVDPDPYAQSQTDAYAQPQADHYAQPQADHYAQPYEDPYAQSYDQAYLETPQSPQYSAEQYAAWDDLDQEAPGLQYVAEEPDSSQDRLVAQPGDPYEARPPEPEWEESPAGPEEPVQPPRSREPKPKRRRRLVAGVGVLIVILGGGAAYKFLGGSPSAGSAGASANATAGRGAAAGGVSASGSVSASPSPVLTAAASVTIPSSAGGLTKMTNKVGQAGVSAMQKSAAGSADLANAQFAEYEKTGSSTFFGNLTLAQLSKAPDIQKTYTLTGAAATLTALGASSLKDGQTITTTIPGSAMACGQFSTGGNTLSLCIWVDPSEFGLFAGPKSLTDTQAAQYAEAIETASEQ